MDAIERFAADVAHEIKNPLSSIRSAIETLRRVEDPVRQRQLLTIIAQDVTRLDRLITDVSDASRLDAELSRITAERVDVVPMLRALRELDEATRDTDNDPQLAGGGAAGAGRGVGGGGPAGAGAAQPDRQRAVVQPAARPHLAARARQRTARSRLSVEDEGPGIPETNLEHVFDRFYSERPKSERFGEHSGLGLSISRQIVEALHGWIGAGNRRDASGKVLGRAVRGAAAEGLIVNLSRAARGRALPPSRRGAPRVRVIGPARSRACRDCPGPGPNAIA